MRSQDGSKALRYVPYTVTSGLTRAINRHQVKSVSRYDSSQQGTNRESQLNISRWDLTLFIFCTLSSNKHKFTINRQIASNVSEYCGTKSAVVVQCPLVLKQITVLYMGDGEPSERDGTALRDVTKPNTNTDEDCAHWTCILLQLPTSDRGTGAILQPAMRRGFDPHLGKAYVTSINACCGSGRRVHVTCMFVKTVILHKEYIRQWFYSRS